MGIGRVFQKSKRFCVFENPGSRGKISLCTRGKFWRKSDSPWRFAIGKSKKEATSLDAASYFC
jgi:hypothetical protein